MILTKKQLSTDTTRLARNLLGCFLVHSNGKEKLIGKIVETEAYLFKNDPACHAHKGMTKRNEAMFGPAGFSYVYLIYGMYHCFNVVSAKQGHGEAVLIRALEPISGIEAMKRNRNTDLLRNLCSGPGKLTQALGINSKHNNLCLRSSAIRLHSRDSFGNKTSRIRCTTSTRIGIKEGADLPLRFLIDDSPYVSKHA